MALPTEQQAQVDAQIAIQENIEKLRHANVLELEKVRAENLEVAQASAAATEKKRAKLETIRLAKELLVENSRSKPVDSREISAEDIVAFAKKLENHIDA